MISYDKAREIVLDAAARLTLASEMVPLSEAVGRVCARDLCSRLSNPSFDNSAMDGYAVRRADFDSFVEVPSVCLRVMGRIAAGDMSSFVPLLSGQCYEIMTGAPIPEGCDAVIPVEKQIERTSSGVSFSEKPKPSGNIRRIGEDFQIGDVILTAGDRLDAAHILTLAGLGLGKVCVTSNPRVAVLSTGREIVDDLSAPLETGQIYNATGPYLSRVLDLCGAQLVGSASIPDDSDAFLNALEKVVREDVHIILSTGAVSAGCYDFVPDSLKKIGAEILFHKVAIKPGKPILCARLPSGALYFGLPGNPASTAAGFRFFVQPALRAVQGQVPEFPISCRLETPYRKEKGLRHFVRAVLDHTETGQARVSVLDGQQSFMLRPFVAAHTWAVVPEECSCLQAGDVVSVFCDSV